jgi:histo-blood group ABO system transferase
MHNYYSLVDNRQEDVGKYDLSIGFVLVATGKYCAYIQPLINSIEKYFLTNNKKHYHIFSDKVWKIEGVGNSYSFYDVEHRPFPYPTLYRFRYFNKYKESVTQNQIIYLDADTLITNQIGTEVLNERTVVQHCGFVNSIGSFETRPESKAYVEPGTAKNYYGGGFYSFSNNEFFKMSAECSRLIDIDESNGIIPVWHDESMMNKYMIDNPPTVVLSPSYHYPENNPHIYNTWNGVQYECKILLLNKNHEEMRK